MLNQEETVMAEETARQPEQKAERAVAQRSLTGSAAVDVAMQLMNGAAAGAGGAIGVHVVNQVLQRPKPPADPPQEMILPRGVERD